MYRILFAVFFFFTCTCMTGLLYAQESIQNEKPEMADLMRSNGKIYVVVMVLLIILAGLFIYMARLDKKLGRLEKNNK
jgi:hypothetical protein